MCRRRTGRYPTFGFLLLDGFSQLAFAAVETLAAANAATGRAFYGWSVVSHDDAPAHSSGDMALAPDAKIGSLPWQTVLVILRGKTMPDARRRQVIANLRRDVGF